MRPHFGPSLLSLFLLSLLIFAIASLNAADEMPGTEGEEIVIPWKKLYRPRGPPRFGKRAFVLLDDETVPVAWRKRLD
ncbi:hypothetical protein niasHS_007143 [Heterodera schachtii]|uniref:Uncharacterized protein n=1 Tax=Heterodera schachtii TaxID=97005 RepID=A0ABD2JL40_HETSC